MRIRPPQVPDFAAPWPAIFTGPGRRCRPPPAPHPTIVVDFTTRPAPCPSTGTPPPAAPSSIARGAQRPACGSGSVSLRAADARAGAGATGARHHPGRDGSGIGPAGRSCFGGASPRGPAGGAFSSAHPAGPCHPAGITCRSSGQAPDPLHAGGRWRQHRDPADADGSASALLRHGDIDRRRRPPSAGAGRSPRRSPVPTTTCPHRKTRPRAWCSSSTATAAS